MGRAPCCDNANVKKGPWSPQEDSKLKEYIEKSGTGGNWLALPQKIGHRSILLGLHRLMKLPDGLKRCGKSCRLRWLNYLRPNLKHGGFSEEEDNIICSLYISIGSRWSIIAAQLPGRTDNDIKNYWNTKLKKKLLEKRKDHQTHLAAEAKQESKDMQSYATSEANTRPKIYGPQQQPGEVDHHMNMGMNGAYSNFGPRITSQLIERNCGSRITEPSLSSESVSFQLNPQQVQLDQELSDHNSFLRTLLQRLEGTVVDHHSNNSMSMISTSSPIQASNCTNPSQAPHSTAHNQYNSSQISHETSASLVVKSARHAGNHIKLENPSACSSPEGGSYESTWMNTFDTGSNNMGGYGFWTELNDLYYAIMTD